MHCRQAAVANLFICVGHNNNNPNEDFDYVLQVRKAMFHLQAFNEQASNLAQTMQYDMNKNIMP